MTALKFRKKPVVIEAIRWTGDNAEQLVGFAGAHWAPIDPEDRSEDPDQTAQIYDKLHSTWIPFCDGDWVIRGVQGELYPCRAEIFEATYEPVQA